MTQRQPEREVRAGLLRRACGGPQGTVRRHPEAAQAQRRPGRAEVRAGIVGIDGQRAPERPGGFLRTAQPQEYPPECQMQAGELGAGASGTGEMFECFLQLASRQCEQAAYEVELRHVGGSLAPEGAQAAVGSGGNGFQQGAAFLGAAKGEQAQNALQGRAGPGRQDAANLLEDRQRLRRASTSEEVESEVVADLPRGGYTG